MKRFRILVVLMACLVLTAALGGCTEENRVKSVVNLFCASWLASAQDMVETLTDSVTVTQNSTTVYNNVPKSTVVSAFTNYGGSFYISSSENIISTFGPITVSGNTATASVSFSNCAYYQTGFLLQKNSQNQWLIYRVNVLKN